MIGAMSRMSTKRLAGALFLGVVGASFLTALAWTRAIEEAERSWNASASVGDCLGRPEAGNLRADCLAVAQERLIGTEPATAAWCDALPKRDDSVDCWWMLGWTRVANVSPCEVAPTRRHRDACVEGLALRRGDANLCTTLSGALLRGHCDTIVGSQR